MPARQHIVVVDDDAAVRDALSIFLETSGYDVSTYPSAEALLEVVDELSSSILLIDQRMSGMSGLDLQADLAGRGKSFPVIFITGHGDVQMSVKAMKSGATDFLEKPFSNEDLLRSIREAAATVEANNRHKDQVDDLKACCCSLTKREREVLEHVVAGRSNSEVAKRLGVSVRTVEVHRARVRQKMAAESLPDLVRKYETCRKAGLLQ